MQDRDTQGVHSLSGFNRAQLIPPDQAQRDAGHANSDDELYLVIELVRPDTKQLRGSTVPAHVREANQIYTRAATEHYGYG